MIQEKLHHLGYHCLLSLGSRGGLRRFLAAALGVGHRAVVTRSLTQLFTCRCSKKLISDELCIYQQFEDRACNFYNFDGFEGQGEPMANN